MDRLFTRLVWFVCALSALALVPGALIRAANPDADVILGLWMTEGGKARVEITSDSDGYRGRIVWLKEPEYPADDEQGMGGKSKVDRKNPDPELRTRPIIGLPLVAGFRYAGNSVWTDGTIYDPESGKTYRCRMTLQKDGTLKVRGYIGISLFGRTTVWTRFDPEETEKPNP